MTGDQALAVLKTGGNIFLTGEPGSGKTHTLNRYIEYCKDHGIEVAVTASTGIAATHIGGMTIHSFSGIGIKDELSPYELDQIVSKESVVKRIGRTKVLVIDEISMLDGRVFQTVETVVRTIKQNNLPFGGIQVVLVGDFFQLPPISRGEEPTFAFETTVWQRLDLLTCYLSEQYRQDDASLGGLLSALRKGEVDEGHYDFLSSCGETAFKEGIEPTKLYTHNRDVDRINTKALEEVEGEERSYIMETRGAKHLVDSLKKSCLSPEELSVKVGAMVMCTKNNFEAGYVNGTLGQVVGYDTEGGHPVIETFSGEEKVIAPASWAIEDNGKVLAEVTQVPLRLAWAITIHKSQGMTLDAAEIDLSSAFEYGQGYVALSRVRSREGLLLRGCNERALQVHPKICQRDVQFQAESEGTVEGFQKLQKGEMREIHERFIVASGGHKESDTSWREKKEKVSTFEETAQLLRGGKTLKEIADIRNLKEGTIVAHVAELLRTGALTKDELMHVLPDRVCNKDAQDELARAVEQKGNEKLAPLRHATKNKYTYDELKLMLALLEAR